nr:PREDICTED: probable palmitoyltransferase ZDHHC16 [Apteryx mantelli mantelli]
MWHCRLALCRGKRLAQARSVPWQDPGVASLLVNIDGLRLHGGLGALTQQIICLAAGPARVPPHSQRGSQFNHRYFFSFCLFMTMGCIYCSISGWDMFRDAYAAIERMKLLEKERLQVAANQTYYQTPPPTFTFRQRAFHKSVVYLWVLCSSVALALGALTLWHAALITRGETSIERHINKKERQRLQKKGKVFRNPYSYGSWNNWKVFLGVDVPRHWLTRVLLPSPHLPHGTGLSWDLPPCVTEQRAPLLAI